MYKKLKERITETTQYYLLRNVHPRAEQPFQVRDDEEMQELVESIRMNGVLNPLIVTPRRGGYEIVSGHRRYAACQKLGVETIPVIVRDLTPDEATLCMIDSNLHREHLLPSEKAYAYKAKMEVLNRQGQRYGQTSSQPATKWDAATEIGKATNESRDQVFRYIRLTNLIKPLMDIVDSGRIAFTPAVELSYLPMLRLVPPPSGCVSVCVPTVCDPSTTSWTSPTMSCWSTASPCTLLTTVMFLPARSSSVKPKKAKP